MGHHILISCTKFVFLFKQVSPLSLLIWALSNGKHPNFFRLLLPSPSLPFLDCAAFPREEAHPSCQSRSGTLFRIVRGFVSKVNEVAETTNICQRGSNLFQLLETGRHSSASRHHARAVSALATTKEHTQRGTDCLLCMVSIQGEKTSHPGGQIWEDHTPSPDWPLIPETAQQERRAGGLKLDTGWSENQRLHSPFDLTLDISAQQELLEFNEGIPLISNVTLKLHEGPTLGAITLTC